MAYDVIKKMYSAIKYLSLTMPNCPVADIFPIFPLHHFMTSDSVITINSSQVGDHLSAVHIIEQALARTGGQDGIRQVFLAVIGNRLMVKPAAHQYAARLLEEQS
jgi:hypothetical protein